MPTSTASLRAHFDGRAPAVRAIYDRVMAVSSTCGPVRVEPKKTSIHLVAKTAFAGVATRKDSLILTIKSASDVRSPRVIKREQTSANRWHVEVRLTSPDEVDAQLTTWLTRAYALAS